MHDFEENFIELLCKKNIYLGIYKMKLLLGEKEDGPDCTVSDN